MKHKRMLSSILVFVMMLSMIGNVIPAYAEPVHTEPGFVEPEFVEPEETEPGETEPEHTEPGLGSGDLEPEYTQPELTEPEFIESEFAELLAADAYDILREKWQVLAMGGDYDPADPNMQGLLRAINDVAQDLLERINPSPTPGWGSNDYLWPEYMLGNRGSAYNNSNNTQFTIRSLKFMALAYQTKGCELYQNERLKDEILRGLDYIYESHFRPGVESNSYGNWFTWEIGGPIYLSETVLLMYEFLSEEKVQAYMATSLRGAVKTGGDAYMYVGANALWRDRVRMYAGILLKNSALLEYVQRDVPTYMGYVTSGDGYYRDGTFIQHGNVVYNGGYGKEAFSDISHFIYMLDSSPWEITGPERDNMSTIVEKSYVPFMHNGIFMDMVRGREITRKDTTDAYAGITIGLDVLLYSETVSVEERRHLQGLVKSWMNNDNAIQTLNEGAGVAWYLFPVYNLSKTLEILNDDTIEPVSTTGKSYTFGKGSRTVHSTDNFTFGLSMYHKDIRNYETGDSNTRGWYTGLGQTFVYTPDLGQFTYQKPTLDWHRLPGVTAVNGVSVGSHTNANAFGGSTTLQQAYSTAGLEISSGNTQVSAKKSWFMFDDEIVALGSGITSAHANRVETTIDNHYITGDNSLIINGERQPSELGWNGAIEQAQWALIEGNVEGSNIGVYFPEETRLGAVRHTRTGKWTDLGSYNVDDEVQSANYLTMWVDHGAQPVNDSYAYVLLPGTTEAQVANYADSSDIEILRQDNEVHAVYEKTLHTLGVNVWQDGDQSIDAMGVDNYLSVDKASSIMVKEDDHKLSLAISDPTKSNTGIITVTVNRAAEGVIARDNRIRVIQTAPYIRLEVDISQSFGNPIEAEFSYSKIEAPGETAITNLSLSDITLNLAFEQAPRATGYKLVYGTESGQYTETLVTSVNTAKITGLDANQTYYFAVRAVNASGEGPLSPERSFSIGTTRTLVDEFEDFSKTVHYSGGWATDATNANTYYEGDATRIKRDDSDKTNPRRAEHITYYTPRPGSFELTTFDYGAPAAGDNTILEFYGSSDNETWAPIPANKNGTVVRDRWSKVIYTNTSELDASINYIRIVVSNNTRIYAPQLSKLIINYAWTSDRVVMDSMLDDSRVYEVKGDAVYMTGDGTAFGGEQELFMKNGPAPATLLYSYTDIQEARLTALVAKDGGGTVTVMSSKDGNTFTPVSARQESVGGDYGEYDKVIYDVTNVEEGTAYLLLTLSGGAGSIAITDVYLAYQHAIAPIQKVHFKDKQYEAVMRYDAAPIVKVAPMNATGELEYSMSDKDVATVNAATGVVQARTLGSAVLTAEILGSGTRESADIQVRTSQNLALQSVVSASSVSGQYLADRAVDGNYLSRWQSGTGNVQWLQIDMGSPKEFGAIELNWQQYATRYVVQGSMNGNDWTTLYTETNGKGGNVWIAFDERQRYRYVRMSGTQAPAAYSLYEFRILSFHAQRGADGVVLQNLALGKTATTSGNDSTNSAPGAAIDGNTSTRWASARTDNQWYMIDLGAPSKIHQLNLLWESAFGREYDLQVIDEAGAVTTVVTERNGSAGWKRYTLDEPVEGRYVRMHGIRRGTNFGYSFFEFEVYGSLAETTVTSIQFVSDALSVLRNHKKTAAIVTDPAVVNEGSVTFVSLNPEIATVSNKGVVTGIAMGTATIKAYSTVSEEIYDLLKVTVTDYNGAPIPVSSLEMQGGVAVIEKGMTAQFDATITPDHASIKNVRWTSSDENILLVTNEGLIKAMHLGTVTVRAISVANPQLVYEQVIRVVDAEVETVKALIGAIGIVTLNSKADIDAAREAYNALSDDKKALVDNYEELTAAEILYAELVEAAEKVSGVTLDQRTMTLTVGESGQLTATITPSSAVNKNVSWSSSNARVATVDSHGKVTAVAEGTATITVVTEDGDKTATSLVTVRRSGSNNGGGIYIPPVTPPPTTPPVTPPTTPNEQAQATIAAGVPVVGDTGAAETVIDADTLSKSLAAFDTVTITIPPAEGATSYVSVLPAAAMRTLDTAKKIIIQTELGHVSLPGNLLTPSQAAAARTIGVTVGTADTSLLAPAVKAELGSRPVVEIAVSADGRKINRLNPEAPVTVELPYTPTAAELADPEHIVVWYIDETGAAIAEPTGKYNADTGMVAFRTTQPGKYAVAYVKKSFGDIAGYPWAGKAIEVMASKGVIRGTSDTTFNPAADITRADFVLLLVRALGLTAATDGNFADVSPSAYYADALATAKALGVTKGIGDNRFNPQGKITREEMMVLAARVLNLAGDPLPGASDAELDGYTDAAQLSGYAVDDVAALLKAGLIQGSGNAIHPKGTATRAEVAVFVYNVYNR